MAGYRKAERTRAKIRIGISGPSGSGKTYSSLLIAYGLAGDWSKVAVIDTENGSADLYSHLGGYSVYPIRAPYEPQKYIGAIKELERNGFECVIIDSLSHAWNGEGGMLDIRDRKAGASGNSYTAWKDVTPIHNRLVEALLTSPAHIIVTCRSKTEYILEANSNGKQAPKKVGMAPIFRDGLEYEMTIFLELTLDHSAIVSKDRTSVFDGKLFTPSEETGETIVEWIEGGVEIETIKPEDADKIYLIMNEKGYDDEAVDKSFRHKYGYRLRGLPLRYLDEAIQIANDVKLRKIEENKSA